MMFLPFLISLIIGSVLYFLNSDSNKNDKKQIWINKIYKWMMFPGLFIILLIIIILSGIVFNLEESPFTETASVIGTIIYVSILLMYFIGILIFIGFVGLNRLNEKTGLYLMLPTAFYSIFIIIITYMYVVN